MTNNRLISIIIPTYNSQKHIKACLESIKNQDYKSFEVIVVDQSSMDDTIKIAKQYGCRTTIRPKPQFYSPPSISRNVGAKEAKGEILYHVDSDMVLEKGLLSEIAKLIEEKYDALIVHEIDITKGFWSKCKAFERRCYWGNDKIESARVVKRSVFEQVGGYDENVSSGEDFNIHKKYKTIGKIGFCKAAVRHNLGELGFLKTVKKKYNYGKTATIYSSENKESGLIVLKDELWCFIRNYKMFLSSPIYGLGCLVLKFSEYLAGVIGLISNKSKKLAPKLP